MNMESQEYSHCEGPNYNEEQQILLNKFLNIFFEHQTVVKMAHFATESYAIHKATDCYLCKFNANFDRFMEVMQGGITKTNINELELTKSTIQVHKQAKALTTYLKNFRKNICTMCGHIKHFPDLDAIRDEMMADVNQLIYVLTFK